jgi:hypothetical protein
MLCAVRDPDVLRPELSSIADSLSFGVIASAAGPLNLDDNQWLALRITDDDVGTASCSVRESNGLLDTNIRPVYRLLACLVRSEWSTT